MGGGGGEPAPGAEDDRRRAGGEEGGGDERRDSSDTSDASEERKGSAPVDNVEDIDHVNEQDQGLDEEYGLEGFKWRELWRYLRASAALLASLSRDNAGISGSTSLLECNLLPIELAGRGQVHGPSMDGEHRLSRPGKHRDRLAGRRTVRVQSVLDLALVRSVTALRLHPCKLTPMHGEMRCHQTRNQTLTHMTADANSAPRIADPSAGLAPRHCHQASSSACLFARSIVCAPACASFALCRVCVTDLVYHASLRARAIPCAVLT
eukprot:1885489-Rhodomonas_salina.1